MLVFDRPERRVQFIDVRDLAAWIVGACETRVTGPVNVTATWTMGDVVDACLTVAPAGTRPVWVAEDRLVAHEVGEWMELPLWIAPASRRGGGADGRAHRPRRRHRPRGAAAGRDGARHARAEATPVDGVGLAPEREQALLADR